MNRKDLGLLEATGLNVVVIDENTVFPKPYFCEGSEAMLALEAMVDRVGIRNVLFALATICIAKSQHLQRSWQDRIMAKVWQQRGLFLEDAATTIRFSDK